MTRLNCSTDVSSHPKDVSSPVKLRPEPERLTVLQCLAFSSPILCLSNQDTATSSVIGGCLADLIKSTHTVKSNKKGIFLTSDISRESEERRKLEGGRVRTVSLLEHEIGFQC